jgi:4,5-DOPA dioxygenase extradiol
MSGLANGVTMERFPTLFISHGSPLMVIQESPAHRFPLELGRSLPRPKAILVASAHWESTGGPAVSLAAEPETIHDLRDRLVNGDAEALLDFRRQAPTAMRNHPTEEHVLPLFVAMGAAGEGAEFKRLHGSYEYGVLAMEMYACS